VVVAGAGSKSAAVPVPEASQQQIQAKTTLAI
jgi:hypothetical protein